MSSRFSASVPDSRPRPVGRAVVDEDELVPVHVERRQDGVDRGDEPVDRVFLVEDADDDRELDGNEPSAGW